MRSPIVAALSILLGVAADAGAPPYDQLVSVGCLPGDPLRLAWHMELEGIDPVESGRIFKQFAGNFDECLIAILERDEELTARIRELHMCAPGEGAETQRLIREAWNRIGFSEALAEVATTGQRGPKWRTFSDACEAIGDLTPAAEPPR